MIEPDSIWRFLDSYSSLETLCGFGNHLRADPFAVYSGFHILRRSLMRRLQRHPEKHTLIELDRQVVQAPLIVSCGNLPFFIPKIPTATHVPCAGEVPSLRNSGSKQLRQVFLWKVNPYLSEK
jgi:hypothetical protein